LQRGFGEDTPVARGRRAAESTDGFPMNAAHHEFDRRAREVHARAGDALPPRLLYALQARRANAASRPAPRAHAGGWWLAGAAAAVFALAIGLRQPGPGAAPALDPAAPTLAAAPALAPPAPAVYDDGLAAPDEDPEPHRRPGPHGRHI